MARQETITRTLYSFDELSDAAKDNARDYFRQSGDLWGWSDEWWKSAQAFGKIAPISIESADYDRGQVECKWTGVDYACRYDHDEAIQELSGLRAWKWLQNNNWFKWARDNKQGACTMTGYCGDCAFADPIAEYEKNPLRVPTLEQVFNESAQSWVQEAQGDCEYAYSDEGIDSLIECNEYEFDESGNIA